ncbi:MAG: LTA synthase family protein [Bacteroidales bacterium]|nr:LTA synthase family protein [Bacteroidales bacterium]
MRQNLLFLLKLAGVLLATFLLQKVVFMVVEVGHAAGAPLGACVAVLWHGLRLDVVTACYVLIPVVLVLMVGSFFAKVQLRKVLSPYYWAVAAVVSILFVADLVLYHFWGAKLDAADLMYAVKPRDMLASIAWWQTVLLLLAVAACVVMEYKLLAMATPRELTNRRCPAVVLLYIPIVAILVLGMRGSLSQTTANPSFAYFSPHAFCNHAALNPTFNMIHSLFKAEDLSAEFVFYDDSAPELQEVAQRLHTEGDIQDTLLRTTRPNVLMVIWESGGTDMVLNDSVGPNISRLSREGVYFSHCYASSFRTDRGVVSLLSGWMGLPTVSLMKMSDKARRLPAIARDLRAEGYSTQFTYGGDIDFTNMRLYLRESGFSDVRGSDAFSASRRLSAWGAPDAYVLTPSAVLPQERPFFAAVLSLSSHEPWEVPFQRLKDHKSNAFAYTDSCLGVLVDSLRTLPVWDSLLLIIVPDHGVSQGSRATSDYHVAHIPVIWTGGAVKQAREIDILMSQSDLAATLLAQMNLPIGQYPLSRNVFSRYYVDSVRFALHSYKNGCNYIEDDGVTAYDCAGRAERPLSEQEQSVQRFSRLQAMLQFLYGATSVL